mgnify:CR=1 FL=1
MRLPAIPNGCAGEEWYKFDAAAAKKMLADAGVSNLSMKLWWMPVARPYNPNGKRMGELLQADWSAIPNELLLH